MARILVPTDFSPAAERALEFALQLAEGSGDEVWLVHAIETITPPGANAYAYTRVLDDQTAAAKEHFEKIEKRFSGQPVKLITELINRTPETVIEELAKRDNVRLVVMGTRGMSGLEKVLIGSTTADVLQNVEKPILAVPESAELGPFRRIVYATNFEDYDPEAISLVLDWAERDDATVECLHINTDSKKVGEDLEDLHELEDEFRMVPVDRVDFKLQESKEVVKGIEEYIKSHPTDLLVMLTKHRNFLQRLFHRSRTAEMAYHARVPLLVLKDAD